jgi:hypothetical protein
LNVNAYKHSILLVAASVVVAFLISQGLKALFFESSLPTGSRGTEGFAGEPVKLLRREPLNTAGLRNPITLSAPAAKAFPTEPLREAVEKSAGGDKPVTAGKGVTLVLVQDRKRFAIIDSKVVHEGDLVGKDRVVKIEKDRVLMRDNSGDKWWPVNPSM